MIKTALCAFGMSGKVFHAPLISAEPQLQLHSVLERSRDEARQTYPDVLRVSNFEEILDSAEIDLVVINTPNELHFPMTQAALQAGKHVVVEKPFTVSIEEGEALIALAKEKDKLLSVFQNKRLESDFLDTEAALHSGKLGRIVEIEWHYDRYRNHITHKRWKEDQGPGAGTWFDLGIHMVDSMLSLFSMPLAVTADMRSLRRSDGAVDYFNVRFDYEDFRVILRSNTFVSEKGPTVTVHGDQGSFLKFGQDVQESQLMKGILPGDPMWAKPGADNFSVMHSQNEGRSFREVSAGKRGCYEKYYRNIADAINGKAPLEFTPQRSLNGVKLLLLAEQSHISAKTVYL